MAYHSASAKVARGLAGTLIPASIQDIKTAIGDIEAWQYGSINEESVPTMMEHLKSNLKGVNARLKMLGDVTAPTETDGEGRPPLRLAL